GGGDSSGQPGLVAPVRSRSGSRGGRVGARRQLAVRRLPGAGGGSASLGQDGGEEDFSSQEQQGAAREDERRQDAVEVGRVEAHRRSSGGGWAMGARWGRKMRGVGGGVS